MKKGFTIIETLVSLAIFATALTAIIIVTSDGVSDITLVKNKYTATYLAQEGIELVRYLRDSQYVSGGTFNDFSVGVTNQCLEGTGCNIDSLSQTVESCAAQGACLIKQDSNSGYFFGNSIGSFASYGDTPFTRVITIGTDHTGQPAADANELYVTSTVTWQQGLLQHKVSTSEHIFNWFRNQ